MRLKALLHRLWRSAYKTEYPTTTKGRSRVILSSLALHLHPVRLPAHGVRVSYTWGLGGLSIFMFVILSVTGAFLMLYYVPTPDAAYNSIVEMQTQVVFGQFMRNLHRWAGHTMLVLVVLHLCRVFYTGAFRRPREFNWIIGLGLLLITLLFSFTGYLLPWDQLAYWAVTVGTEMAGAAPLIGGLVRNMLVGGPEVGQATLIRWYALHAFILPISLVILSALHFWRVRKNGGISTPTPEAGQAEPDRVFTWPHLVSVELAAALVYLIALSIMAVLVKAPLLDMANPAVTPNPAKAPWYFVGLQELLLHMLPALAGVLLPLAVLLVFAAFPYTNTDDVNTGIWFGSPQGKRIALFAAIYGAVTTGALVIADELLPAPSGGHGLAALLMGWGIPPLIAAGLVPVGVIALVIWGLLRIVDTHWQANRGQRLIALFTLFIATYAVLTIIGVAFRGPGMQLVWPS